MVGRSLVALETVLRDMPASAQRKNLRTDFLHLLEMTVNNEIGQRATSSPVPTGEQCTRL
jgi:hypothetical protein